MTTWRHDDMTAFPSFSFFSFHVKKHNSFFLSFRPLFSSGASQGARPRGASGRFGNGTQGRLSKDKRGWTRMNSNEFGWTWNVLDKVLDKSPVLQVQWALGWMLVEAFKQSLGVEMYRDVSRCPNEELWRIVWRAGDDVNLPSSCHQAAIMLPSAIIRFRLHGVPRRRRDPEEVESLNLRTKALPGTGNVERL